MTLEYFAGTFRDEGEMCIERLPQVPSLQYCLQVDGFLKTSNVLCLDRICQLQ